MPNPLPMPKILCVLDTYHRRDNVTACADEVDWLAVELESHWVDTALACDGRMGFIFEIKDRTKSENGTWVYIHESLFLLKHFEQIFKVYYISWESHKQRMLQANGWPYYVGRWDCFFGGPDIGLDLGKKCYNLNTDEEQMYRHAMEHLHNAIPVWPPVLEQADAIKKHTLAVNLKRISQERNLHHPRSYLLTEQKPTSAEWERKMWVLKREHSECTENVKLPKDNETLTLEIRRKLLQDRYMWLAQEYMPLLRDIGEWRVIVVGGRVENVVFTHPLDSGRVAFVVVDHFKTLPDMQSLLKMGKSRDYIALHEQGSSDAGKQQLYDFVEWHVDRLATLEEKLYKGENSSLRVFCRIDVGLLLGIGKELQYFVHEVERGPSTCLFARCWDDHSRRVANKFSNEFLGWYKHRSVTIY